MLHYNVSKRSRVHVFQVQIYELEEHKIETWRGDCTVYHLRLYMSFFNIL